MSDRDFIADCNLRLAFETHQLRLQPARVAAGVAALLADPAKGIYFIGECDGVPAGQLLITYEWSDWRNGNFWWIQSVYVLEKFRSHGIFRALFRHIQTLAKSQRDVCGLRLYVASHNSLAQEVYRRMGMQKAGNEMFEEDFVLEPRV